MDGSGRVYRICGKWDLAGTGGVGGICVRIPVNTGLILALERIQVLQGDYERNMGINGMHSN